MFKNYRGRRILTTLVRCAAKLLLAVILNAAIVSAQTVKTIESSIGNSDVSAAAPTAAFAADAQVNEQAANLVQLGDELDVDIRGSLEYDWRGKPDDEGLLSNLPQLTVRVPTICRTENEIAADIAAAYGQFLRNPEVVVRVLDRSARQPVILFGAIRNQQRFRLERAARLSELLTVSGGITDTASGEIEIFRPARVACEALDQAQTEARLHLKIADLIGGKPEANPFVRTGDIITITEAAPVFVIGGVFAPQRILFRSGLTLTRAIASVGGLAANAEAAQVTVFRRQQAGADTKTIQADYKKIIEKATQDVPLEPFDVVEVGQAGRQQSKRLPVIEELDSAPVNLKNLPLRVIN